MSPNDTERKPFGYLLLLSALILLPAMMFAISADLPHVFLVSGVGVGISLMMRRPVAYSDRSIIYSLIAAITIAALLNLMFPMRDNRLGYISIFFRPHILVPFLLNLSVCVTLFKPHPRGYGIITACSLVCMMFGGDVFNTNVTGERMPFCNPLIEHFNRTYMVFVFLDILTVLAAGFYWMVTPARVIMKRTRFRLLVLRLAVLFMIPALTLAALYLYNRNERAVRQFENYLLRFGVRKFMRPSGRVSFNKEVDLNMTIDPEMRKNFAVILLRVRSKTAPGYLRGKAYTTYRHGHWLEQNKPGPEFNEKQYGGMIAYTTYTFKDKLLPQNAENINVSSIKPVKYDIFPDSKFSTETLLLPGNFNKIDIITEEIKCDCDGSVGVKEWTRDGGYSCFVPRSVKMSSWPLPADGAGEAYLQVPTILKDKLAKFYDIVVAKYKGRKLKDSEIVNILSAYLSSRFEYKIGVENKTNEDPVINFLLNARKGHCELFATATVLLLRSRGIPARYVTGFICEEKHPSGNYFVSRIGNAHAWVEAYPRDKGHWELVEPTPASGIPTGADKKWGTFENFGDRLSLLMKETLALMRRGVVAKAIVKVFSGLYGLIIWFLANPFRALLVLALFTGLLVYLIRRARKKRKNRNVETNLPDDIEILRKAFLKMEKSIAKKYNITRTEGETIDEWLERIEKNSEKPLPKKLRLVIDQYRRVRFSGSSNTGEDVKAVEKQVSEKIE